MYTFVPNRPFASLLKISQTNNIFLKTFNSEFQEIKIWFTGQTSNPLEVEDKIDLTLKIGYYKMRYSIEPRDRRYVKGYGFLSFAKNIGKNIGKNISNKIVKNLLIVL